jgi:hypothetical protein
VTDASPITLNTDDGISVADQPKNSACSGQKKPNAAPDRIKSAHYSKAQSAST